MVKYLVACLLLAFAAGCAPMLPPPPPPAGAPLPAPAHAGPLPTCGPGVTTDCRMP